MKRVFLVIAQVFDIAIEYIAITVLMIVVLPCIVWKTLCDDLLDTK